MRKKKYIPPKKLNPVLFDQRISSLKEEIEKQRQVKEMQMSGLQNYFSKLTNFTSHDIKNAIQNMDSIVSTLDTNKINDSEISTIKTCLNAIRKSLDDFYKLSPDGRKVEFTLLELAKTVEILNKAAFTNNNIVFSFNTNGASEIIISQPFHSLVQVLNNLILNSIKALEAETAVKKIQMNCNIDESRAIIKISDNGKGIDSSDREKIFEIYFSTTGGSGIGLAHSTFVLNGINGTISLTNTEQDFNSTFEVIFPIKGSND